MADTVVTVIAVAGKVNAQQPEKKIGRKVIDIKEIYHD